MTYTERGRGRDRGYSRGGSSSSGSGRGSSTRGWGRAAGSSFTEQILEFASKNEELYLLLQNNPETAPSTAWKDTDHPLDKIPKRKIFNLQAQEYCITDPGSSTIFVNHFPVKIVFPRNKVIYEYSVDIERAAESLKPKESPKLLPASLRQRILMYLLPILTEKFGKQCGIISDFSSLLYTIDRLENVGPALTTEINGSAIVGLTEDYGSSFKITINGPRCNVDTSHLVQFINNMENYEPPKILGEVERIYCLLVRSVKLSVFTPMQKRYLIDYSKEPHPLGGGIVSYSGYNVHLPLINGWKKFINIESANMVTYMDKPISEVLTNLFADSRDGPTPNPNHVSTWSANDFEKASAFFRNCKVIYSPEPGRSFSNIVVGICHQSVSQLMFDYNGVEISVYDYYESKYRNRLSHLNGPVFVCKGRSNPKIPVEICTIQRGQSYSRQLTEIQRRNIGQKSILYPGELYESISRGVNELDLKQSELFQLYGVQLKNGGKMHEVSAKVLTPPQLCYGKSIVYKNLHGASAGGDERCTIIPNDGAWDIWNNQVQFEFYGGANNIGGWGILNLAGSRPCEEIAKGFAVKLRKKAMSKNMIIPALKDENYCELNLQDSASARDHNFRKLSQILTEFKDKLDQNGVSFVLVIMPSSGCHLYSHVKQAAELSVGILTQCIVNKSIVKNINNPDLKKLDSLLGNILLKINSKLNQVNHVVLPPPTLPRCFSVFNSPVLIIGADVTHPSPGSYKIVKDEDGFDVEERLPSFAAVTSSIDRTMMPYMMHIQAQKREGKEAAEIITGLDRIVFKFLENFKNNTKGCVPTKIIYFRDGVGEGQFDKVLEIEMRAIRQGCTQFGKCFEIDDGYQPGITFITVQKRHKTRFFKPTGSTFTNARPGTVIDTDIVHPDETDFYLLSHKSAVGTSRPTRYRVLWDDSNFSMNEIQVLTYFLCYMFVRCNRSVKIPAPTYYAHWAAKRAEVLSKGWGERADMDELNRRLGETLVVNEFRRLYPMHFV